MSKHTAQTGYIPGICNINRAEIAYRRKAGFFGLGLYIVITSILFALGSSRWARLILFVPAFIAAIGFLQARNKFCVAYGAAGQQNASEGSTKAQSVTEQAAIVKDKARARTMNIQAAMIAFAAIAIMLIF